MFINCLWLIEQLWETVFKPFTMKICEVIFGFLLNIFERQGPEKRDVSFFCCSVYVKFRLSQAKATYLTSDLGVKSSELSMQTPYSIVCHTSTLRKQPT